MLFDRQRAAQPRPVLMAADAPQRIASAVEEEAFFRIKDDGTHAETGADFVSGGQRRRCFIQKRIVHAIPQAGMIQNKYRLRMAAFRNGLPGFAVQGKSNRSFCILPGFHSHFRRSFFQDGRHFDTGRAVSDQFKMLFRDNDQFHIAVQPAVERKIRFLGINPVIFAVVHGDAQQVFIPKIFRQIRPEGGITSFMAGQLLSVHIYFRRHGRAFDRQEAAVSFRHQRP